MNLLLLQTPLMMTHLMLLNCLQNMHDAKERLYREQCKGLLGAGRRSSACSVCGA